MTDKTEFLNGNTACAEGAIAAGCRFFAGYPITPSTEVAERMAVRLPKIGGTFIQMEDELASMAAIIGGAWAGARTMTATSGPGFSLMMENIGYAAMTETPCVVVNVQRGGPSTGQPTMAAQGDMMQARFGSHGDYSIIALAPSSVQEMFDLTVKAFNLADRFRTPVFLMTDETIGHMREKVILRSDVEITPRRELLEGELPFRPGPDGVPGFGTFGRGLGVHVTGLTHDERGYPATDSADLHEKVVRRMVRKIEDARNEIADVDIVNPDAEIVFISYGAPTRAVQQLLADYPGIYGHLNLRIVWPFPDAKLGEFGAAKAFVVPEMNLGQMAREVRMHTNVPIVTAAKLGGALHTVAELKHAADVAATAKAPVTEVVL
ncbi:2-oxoacid:acceptor oxidoreductase subunit alpha [Methanorbis furvi]|uniref:2-oxoglutarate synthase subunit KorA n=1 Tax=Methanorbis furvi TaxID=3028299 RepID=A0AAE4MCN6_9EURY|nr:2-oxoglutarate oxidoreductase subunit KorA [Methanocorpusculaceae archaeon Ag1]